MCKVIQEFMMGSGPLKAFPPPLGKAMQSVAWWSGTYVLEWVSLRFKSQILLFNMCDFEQVSQLF